MAGDGINESEYHAAAYDQLQWRNAMIVSSEMLRSPTLETPCARAVAEGHPTAYGSQLAGFCRLHMDHYESLRHVATAIQMAGPQLDPGSVEEGLRSFALPYTSDPYRAACSHADGDQTCVDDVVVGRWDPLPSLSGIPGGCWRLSENGRRWQAGTWPASPADGWRVPSGSCSGWGAAHPIR